MIRDTKIIPAEYLKKLTNTDGIWEVRATFGGNAIRLLGFMEEGNLVVLTNGFAKKTQKTPANEIALAEQRMNEYKKRGSDG
ncbi:type II toxin-antitoxin system RelE/ParE family toxin [Chlorobium sp. KB01]|uniref:type II toxin-antitoxin system RelE/ParE family toxin n=1 Tax=Chlorobium sp. KB01 TaxID=1917528 RepID=UPI001E4ECC5D|nr:type II toxin-antitoxin system RelE/ParE family toxin [Chlorobium sp. KB01]